MQIQIDKLKRMPRLIVVDEQAEAFPVLQELMDQGAVSFTRKITGSLEAAWAGGNIEVKGQLMTSVECPCGRCLLPVALTLSVPVLFCYHLQSQDDESLEAEELELQAEDLGLIPFVGPDIDLRNDLEQEVVMSIPQQPLCEEGCRGLCPVCGVVVNKNSCDCVPPVFHAGLGALQNFKVKE